MLFSKSTSSLPSARAVRGCQRARHQDKGRHMCTFWKRSFHQLLHDPKGSAMSTRKMSTRKDRRPIFDTKDRRLYPVDLRISCLIKQSYDHFCHFSAMVFPSMSLWHTQKAAAGSSVLRHEVRQMSRRSFQFLSYSRRQWTIGVDVQNQNQKHSFCHAAHGLNKNNYFWF